MSVARLAARGETVLGVGRTLLWATSGIQPCTPGLRM